MSYVSCNPIEISEPEKRNLKLTEENRKLREESVTLIKEFQVLWGYCRELLSIKNDVPTGNNMAMQRRNK